MNQLLSEGLHVIIQFAFLKTLRRSYDYIYFAKDEQKQPAVKLGFHLRRSRTTPSLALHGSLGCPSCRGCRVAS